MERKKILDEIWKSQDEAYALMAEYDSLPHYYGDDVLYQAEAYIIRHIGLAPGITTTELAAKLKKTPSACSQIVKKLVDKNLVLQERNAQNRRLYNLRLTKDGEKVFYDHIEFNECCQKQTFDMLSEFSIDELNSYLCVQKQINEAYRSDVQRSKEHFGKES